MNQTNLFPHPNGSGSHHEKLIVELEKQPFQP